MTGLTASRTVAKIQAIWLRLKPGQHGHVRAIRHRVGKMFRRKKKIVVTVDGANDAKPAPAANTKTTGKEGVQEKTWDKTKAKIEANWIKEEQRMGVGRVEKDGEMKQKDKERREANVSEIKVESETSTSDLEKVINQEELEKKNAMPPSRGYYTTSNAPMYAFTPVYVAPAYRPVFDQKMSASCRSGTACCSTGGTS